MNVLIVVLAVTLGNYALLYASPGMRKPSWQDTVIWSGGAMMMFFAGILYAMEVML